MVTRLLFITWGLFLAPKHSYCICARWFQFMNKLNRKRVYSFFVFSSSASFYVLLLDLGAPISSVGKAEALSSLQRPWAWVPAEALSCMSPPRLSHPVSCHLWSCPINKVFLNECPSMPLNPPSVARGHVTSVFIHSGYGPAHLRGSVTSFSAQDAITSLYIHTYILW